MKNVIYMGKDKIEVINGLKYLIEKKYNIYLVCAKKNGMLWNFCTKNNISVCLDTELYDKISHKPDIDLVISYLFWRKIKKVLIDLPKLYCLNFHPGPLPECKGLGGYNLALLFNKNYYGVTCHHIEESIDDGNIVEKILFEIDCNNETIYSLEKKSMEYLFQLYKSVIEKIDKNEKLISVPQIGNTWNNIGYISMKKFNSLREIKEDDSLEIIERKIRAFFFPPFDGAIIKIKDKDFTLVSTELLKNIEFKKLKN